MLKPIEPVGYTCREILDVVDILINAGFRILSPDPRVASPVDAHYVDHYLNSPEAAGAWWVKCRGGSSEVSNG